MEYKMNNKQTESTGWTQDLNDQTTAIDMIRVKVDLTPSDLFTDLASAYFAEVTRITRFENKVSTINEESMLKYFQTLLYLHVQNVNSRVKTEYNKVKYNAIIPTPIYTLLTQIGEVVDKNFGLKFYPSFEIDSTELLSPSEMIDFGYELLRMENLGLKLTTNGLPSSNTSGELGFMGAYAYENEVRSYRHDNPVYGFYAAMFKTKGIEQALGISALRVRYGYIDHYKSLIQVFVHEGQGS
jgi:hypothetical protein